MATATLPSDLAPAMELAEKGNQPYPNESDEYRPPAPPCSPRRSSCAGRSSASPSSAARCRPARSPGTIASSTSRAARSACSTCSAPRHAVHLLLDVRPRARTAVSDVHVVRRLVRHSAPDIEQRLALAIVGRSPVARQLAVARERGWSHLRFYQTVGDDFGRDYHVVTPEGEEGAASDDLAARRRHHPPVVGGRGRRRDHRPRLRPALGPRRNALEHPRLDARRTGHGLVPVPRVRTHPLITTAPAASG